MNGASLVKDCGLKPSQNIEISHSGGCYGVEIVASRPIVSGLAITSCQRFRLLYFPALEHYIVDLSGFLINRL